MKRILALFLALSVASHAWGGWPDARVVRLDDGGSGAFVEFGGTRFILSCAHRTATTPVRVGDRVSFTCFDDARGVATVAAVAPFDLDGRILSDAAIFTFQGGTDRPFAPFYISAKCASPGERVWVCGFPFPGSRFSSRTTTVRCAEETLVLDGPSTPGESGGPIVDANGHIVGTLTATTSDATTLCCGQGVIADLCQRFYRERRACPTGNCPNGACPLPRPQQYTAPQPPQPETTGPAGPQGPPGPPGKDATCFCEVKWQSLSAEVNEIKTYLASMKQPASTDEIVAEVIRRLPPVYMRVDPTAQYQPVKPGQYVTLPLDMR